MLPTLYIPYFILVIFFAIIINHLLLKFLKNIGQRHNPSYNNANNAVNSKNLVRWASQTKPAIGGFGFFIAFLLSVCAYFVLPVQYAVAHKSLFALLGSVTLGFLIGLIDDSYNTPPYFKFLGQLLCAAIMITMGIYINISDYIALNAAFTTLWVVGIMNAINLLDNMDGITASVSMSIVGMLLMSSYSIFSTVTLYNMVLIGVLGALGGFLVFNWHPSKMYMGDSGSQFLGVVLAFMSIKFMWNMPGTVGIQQFIIPAIAFLLPVIDTTTVFIRRIARGQSPFEGGRDHTTHHLVYCGLRDNEVAWAFIGISVLNILVLASLLSISTWTVWHSAISIAYIVLVFIVFQWTYEYGKQRKK